jgi:hypothetical protein
MTDKDMFKDAVETSPLVVSGQATKTVSLERLLEDNLQNKTKQQLVEFAEEHLGLDLDRRLTKQNMIDKILEECE